MPEDAGHTPIGNISFLLLYHLPQLYLSLRREAAQCPDDPADHQYTVQLQKP